MRKQQGISLVEILVVIVIIGILAGLSMSVFRRSVTSSKTTVTISNIRQIYVASSLYFEKHGQYPPLMRALGDIDPVVSQMKPPLAVPGGAFTDYFLTGNFGPDWAQHTYPFKQNKACFELRQGEYPLVVDLSQVETRNAVHAGRRLMYYGRADGSIDHTDYPALVSAHRARKTPCPDALQIVNAP